MPTSSDFCGMENISDCKEQVTDLGIMMSNTATFTLQIRNIVKKPRDKMECELRVFQSLKHFLMLTLLKSLVVPLIEYCCQLWNPWKAKDIQALEAFQITSEQHLNYWERLHKLKLYSVQRRCERYMIKYIWKITQHMVQNIHCSIGQKIKTKRHPRHGSHVSI